ncbi:hypothetical protein COY90_04075 [Candidatus Roizmanbacteria bacterium CG_4_10_14_0_8_um_filter_39_9]|uniref:Uncharacterized protein n=1 Tax=Candidatus Roizmanbacteria bacterium CG_4_10_14_0_8_um_filter_39_9 TaxID=1974829 RepID=A0A2M7QC18_9BACT|nr:MAG: hypothetical protein COY90_04075 [Candidatus Roizmanbacteria bacterium CG_4_10_14_0_8_um_filter_39_9]
MEPLIYYMAASVIYVMLIHFALAIKGQFNIFLMIGVFVFGGVLGLFLNSYQAGFVAAIILSLIFW